MADFYAGTTNSQLHLQIYEASYDVNSNTSQVQVNVWLERTSGSGKYSSYTNNSWSDSLDNGAGASGSGTYDLRGGGSQLLLSNTFPVAHNSDGTRTVSGSASFNDPHGNIAAVSVGGSVALTTIPRYPAAPSLDSITNVTLNSLQLNGTAPSNTGGSAITSYDYQVAIDSAFTSPTTTNNTTTTAPLQQNFNALASSTVFYARMRANNAQGAGAWSNVISTTTGAAGAPHLGVIRKPDASGFYLIPTAPLGVISGLTSWTWIRSVSGPNAPVDVTTTVTAPTTLPIFDAYVLQSGQSVTYRISALVSAVQTANSSSVTLAYQAVASRAPLQPEFSGSSLFSAAYTNQLATWAGTADASASILKGSKPKGWRSFSQGAGSSGAVGVVTSIGDTLVGFAITHGLDVAMIVANTQTAAGLRLGTEIGIISVMTQAFASVTYYGQISAMTETATRLAAEIEFFSTSGLLLGRATGIDQLVPANTSVALLTSGVAPSNTAYAAINVVDVAGTSWAATTARYAGQAMITASSAYPYFDGGSLASAAYSYSWRGSVDASTSLRTASATSNALVDPNATAIPTPPRAPAPDNSTLTNDIVWRRYVALIPAVSVREWISNVPTLKIFASIEDARNVRVRYWQNPANTPAAIWSDTNQTYSAELIIGYIPKGSTFVLDGVAERASVQFSATPSVAASQVAADHLVFGTGGGPVTWPLLKCGVAYILTMDVPTTAAPGNLTPSIILTDRIL